MWSTPSSTARRSTRSASSRSRGGPMTPGPGSCMAPKPTRRTVRSARGKVSVIPSTLGVGVRSNARPPAPSDAPTFDTRLRTTVAIAITTCEITLSNNGFRRIQAESGRTSSFASRAVRRTHNVSHPLRARHDADPLFGKTRLRSVTSAHEPALERAHHLLRSTEEGREEARLGAHRREHLLDREPRVGLGVDEVEVQLLVVADQVRDLVGERRRTSRRVEEVDAVRQLPGPDGAEPAEHRRDPDPARDPHLVLGAPREVEMPLWAADDGRHARRDEIADARREVAEGADRDPDLLLLRAAGDREGVAVPAVAGLEVDEGELAGAEGEAVTERTQPDLVRRVVDGRHRRHLVVMGPGDTSGQQLAVEVEGETDATDRDVGPPQQLRSEDGRVHEAVDEPESQKDPGQAMDAAPEPVAADPPAHEPDRWRGHE